MASNVRKCDVCGSVFEISHAGGCSYNRLALPSPRSLRECITEYASGNDIRKGVWTRDYDICVSCLVAICEAMLARKGLEG